MLGPFLLAPVNVRADCGGGNVHGLPAGEADFQMVHASLGPIQGPLAVDSVVIQEVLGQLLEPHTVCLGDDGPAGRDVALTLSQDARGLGFLLGLRALPHGSPVPIVFDPPESVVVPENAYRAVLRSHHHAATRP